jgi:glycosyltransferase involved in cell wall biosynthesis
MSKIEFIIPTYERTDHLMCIINSIVSQRSDMWKIHVIADCPPEDSLKRINKIMDYFKDDERIKFTILPERYNDWGHTPRNYGVEQSTEDWIVMTGEDNYYVPIFVDNFLSAVEPNVGLIFCNMVHNWIDFQYFAIDCKPEWGKIDIGNFIIRRDLAQQMKLDTEEIQSDGKYIEEFKVLFPDEKIIKISKILYVHN